MLQRHRSAAPRSQLRPSISRDTRGDALTQLLNNSLSFEHVTGFYKAHRIYLVPRCFRTLCKAVRVDPMPRCYLSQLSEVEVGSAANFQLAGGSIQVESTRHDLRSVSPSPKPLVASGSPHLCDLRTRVWKIVKLVIVCCRNWLVRWNRKVLFNK